MPNDARKVNSFSTDVYPGSDVNDRAMERAGLGFDLRETLGDTEVNEVSFADFLAELKKIGKK